MCRPCGQIDFLGLSTADHEVNYPTITRCLQRALAGKYDRLEVVNLFMLCSADPDGLLTHAAPLGEALTVTFSAVDNQQPNGQGGRGAA